ncbi:hypothetical protein DS891_01480 [Pseudoalteromonas sp. JC28]|nr:hypothetical protein [Pseudoalteromonas sp. JC28]
MADLLFKIGDFVVFINFVALILFVKSGSKDESILWSLVVLCIFNGMMHGWGYFLKSKFDIYDRELMRHLWYLSFSVFYLTATSFLCTIHVFREVRASKFAVLVSASFVVITMVTVLRYVSYVLLNVDSEVLRKLYQYSIPYVNICVAFSAVFVTIKYRVFKRSL